MCSSVLSSQGHTLLIGFFGDFFGNGLQYPSLMDPRARDERVCRNIGFLVLLGWIALSVCALSHALSMACPCVGRHGRGGSLFPTEKALRVERVVFWGNTVANVVFG